MTPLDPALQETAENEQNAVLIVERRAQARQTLVDAIEAIDPALRVIVTDTPGEALRLMGDIGAILTAFVDLNVEDVARSLLGRALIGRGTRMVVITDQVAGPDGEGREHGDISVVSLPIPQEVLASLLGRTRA